MYRVFSTFTGAADFNSHVHIDGDTQLDDLTVAGVATFSSASQCDRYN